MTTDNNDGDADDDDDDDDAEYRAMVMVMAMTIIPPATKRIELAGGTRYSRENNIYLHIYKLIH